MSQLTNKVKFLLFFMLIGATLGLMGSAMEAPTHAAAPECYGLVTTTNPPSTNTKACNSASITGLSESIYPNGLKDDHCYITGLGAIFTGAPLLSEFELSNPFCVDAKAKSTDTIESDFDPEAPRGTGEGLDSGGFRPSADTCGLGNSQMKISLNVGCRGEGNGIVDLTLAITRFLSVGVGIVAVGSIIVGGIQYTTAGGSPEQTAKAIKRISNTVIALLIYFLIFAILNWLVPGGVF